MDTVFNNVNQEPNDKFDECGRIEDEWRLKIFISFRLAVHVMHNTYIVIIINIVGWNTFNEFPSISFFFLFFFNFLRFYSPYISFMQLEIFTMMLNEQNCLICSFSLAHLVILFFLFFFF